MTKKGAIILETKADQLFAEVGFDARVSMTLSGMLRVDFDNAFQRGSIAFDYRTGTPVYINFRGDSCDLFHALEVIKRVCTDEDNKVTLELLKWSYDHIGELTEEDNG